MESATFRAGAAGPLTPLGSRKSGYGRFTYREGPCVSAGDGSEAHPLPMRTWMPRSLVMRRIAMSLLIGAVLLLAVGAVSAIAVAAKFHSVTSSVDNSGALVVSFDQRGLGNEDISYTLTADAVANFYCINGGGKNPAAANKRTVNAEVSAGGTFSPRNGRVIASLSAGPPSAGDFSCPPGQRLRFGDVTYTNIVLTDTTNGVTVNVADASRTFFVPGS
jgi:hypothetical protein